MTYVDDVVTRRHLDDLRNTVQLVPMWYQILMPQNGTAQ